MLMHSSAVRPLIYSPRLFSSTSLARQQLSPKLEGLIDSISSLTLIETNALVQALKEKLNIKDVAPMMAQMAMPAAAAAPAPAAAASVEEAAPEKPAEKTEFIVKLEKFDAASKAKVIREIKNINPAMNLVEAKKFVESVPKVIKESVPKEEAEKWKKALEAVGATVILE
ncbi:hypothetical protein HK098_000504 [Nowakowskiella sp. JEL0407]|nr:hypothetical protein HK098_000504 [Nowakowskiella sp. JEL0407]